MGLLIIFLMPPHLNPPAVMSFPHNLFVPLYGMHSHGPSVILILAVIFPHTFLYYHGMRSVLAVVKGRIRARYLLNTA